MRILKLMFFGILIFSCAGCATSIKYKVDKAQYKNAKPLDYTLAVDIVEDVRPAAEHDGTFYNTHDYYTTQDKRFKPGVGKQISQTLVDHFKAARAFTIIELRNVDNDLDKNPQEMELLRKEGVDLAVIGNLKHFYGFQSQSPAEVLAGVMFGAIGALTEMIANPRTVGGKVEYADVKIIDLDKKKILWQGSIEHEFREKDTFYDGQKAYALRALKETNNKFVKKIREICEADQDQIAVAQITPAEDLSAKVAQSKQDISIVNKELEAPAPEVNVRPRPSSYGEYYRLIYNTVSKAAVKPQGCGSGVVNMSLTLLSNGDVESIEILDGSSEDAALRSAAEKAVKDSLPFPIFSEDMKDDKKTLILSMDFKFNR